MEIVLFTSSKTVKSEFIEKYGLTHQCLLSLMIGGGPLGLSNPISMIRALFKLEPKITVHSVPQKYGSFTEVVIDGTSTYTFEIERDGFTGTDQHLRQWCVNKMSQ